LNLTNDLKGKEENKIFLVCDGVKTCKNRRFFARLKRSLPITLLDREVKSKNISPEGVYFEVTIKDIENYSPGKMIMVEVEFTDSKFAPPERTDKFIGF
jgi:hypothetical protein